MNCGDLQKLQFFFQFFCLAFFCDGWCQGIIDLAPITKQNGAKSIFWQSQNRHIVVVAAPFVDGGRQGGGLSRLQKEVVENLGQSNTLWGHTCSGAMCVMGSMSVMLCSSSSISSSRRRRFGQTFGSHPIALIIVFKLSIR
jgi:hypothetical protein